MITPRDAAEADRLAGELADHMGNEAHEEELRNEREANIQRHTEYRFSAASAPTVVDDANRAPQESWDALVWAFVQGVRWWEVEKTGATLWASDRNKAERAARVTLTTVMEAEKWRGINPVSPRPITSADYAKALRRIDELTFALQRTVNLIEQGLPDLARKVGLRELKKS
jgi:hypothetical protein